MGRGTSCALIYTGWPRVQSNTLTSCFSVAAGRISTKFELDTAYMFTFCRLKFWIIRFGGSKFTRAKLNHGKSAGWTRVQ